MDYLHISYWSIGVFVIILDDLNYFKYLAEGLKCNYCFNADIVQDCYYTSQVCKFGEVCALDSTELTYTIGAARSKTKTVWQYKMGCAPTITCRDGASYGPGPYGYSKIHRQCCCSDLCSEPDGVGQGHYQNCPNAFDNQTSSSAASFLTLKSSNVIHTGYYSAFISWIYYITY